MDDTPYNVPRLILHLEGATIDELRANAILALDLRIAPRGEAAAAVETLKNEPKPMETQAESDRVDTVEADATATVSTDSPKPVETQAKKRGRKPKAEPSIAAANAKTEPLDLETVRGAFDEYVKMFGVSAAQTDGPVLLSRVFGNGIQRIKDIPVDDQAKLGRIIAAVQGAILTNEFNRPTVAGVQ